MHKSLNVSALFLVLSGPSLLDYLDSMPSLDRSKDAPVRLPVVDRYKDMGTIVLGKIESGTVTKNMTLLMMPNKVKHTA